MELIRPNPHIEPVTLILLDGMALVHPFASTLGAMGESAISKLCHNWVAMMQRPYLYLPKLQNSNTLSRTPIILWDQKNDKGKYWRHQILPTYKGSRKAKSSVVTFVAETIARLWDSAGLLSFSESGFEADDWAGRITSTQAPDDLSFIMTSDSDWGQLVTDRVFWLDSYGRSKMRAEGRHPSQCTAILGSVELIDRVNNHPSMGSYPITHPYELVDNKWTLGDWSSDRIPSGQVEGCRGIIDLKKPTLYPSITPEEMWRTIRDWEEQPPLFLNPAIRSHHLAIPEFSLGSISSTGQVTQPHRS